MMNQDASFGRLVSVKITSYNYVNGKQVVSPINPNDPDSALVINQLRVVFRCEKSFQPTPNQATIEIYNLSPRSRAYIEQKHTCLELYAGYNGNREKPPQIPLIFKGDVLKVSTKRSGADIVTSIEAGDSAFLYGQKSKSQSYAPGTTWGWIFNDFVNTFSLSLGQVKGANQNAQYANGFSFIGAVKDAITNLANKQGLEWNVQDGKLYMLPEKVATDHAPVLLNPATGLVGSPFTERYLRQDQQRKQLGLVAEAGIHCTSLLNGQITVNHPIQIISEYVTGTLKVRTVLHEGDTHGGPWFSTIEATGSYVAQGTTAQAFAAQGAA